MYDIGHDHYVFGNRAEIEEYKKIRESGVPLKSIKIKDPDAPEEEQAEEKEENVSTEPILDAPIHDTGNKLYALLSFFIPLFGFIAWPIFKKHRYYKNFRMCQKGAIAGVVTIGVILTIFLLALLIAII